MSSVSVRCPHCAAFQARSPVKPAAATRSDPPRAMKVSSEEARAMLSVSAVRAGDDVEAEADEPGVFAGMVLPHPRSSGGTRVAEIVLTVIAAPLVALSLVALASLYLRVLRFGGLRARPAGFRIFGGIAGAFALGCFLFAADLSTTVVAAVLAIEVAALLARAAVRSVAKRRRSATFDLTR
ncbi:MAG: hypothetical protein M3Y87_17485 [Myxococcota bacterium]|nr:hypothetical protein [Myxococcota bacterium]